MVRCWIVYWIVLLICLVCSSQGERGRRRGIWYATFVLVFFSGFRSWWYGDLIKYYSRFLTESRQSLIATFEEKGIRNLGLSIINKIAFLVFGKYGYDVLIFLIALFSAVTLAKVIKKYSFSPYWSFLMYLSMGFYTFTFSGLKQTIAMGFLCLAMISLLEDKWLSFLIYVGLGALFHTPAFIFAVAYPVSKKKINRWYILYMAVIIGAMLLFRDQLAFLLEDAYYSDVSAMELQAETHSGVGGRFIGMLFIMVVASLLRVPNKKDEIYSKVFNIMTIAAAIQTMSVFNNTYTRLADYYYQFVVLFVPMFMQPVKKIEELKYRKIGVLGNNPAIYLIIGIATTLFSIWFFSLQIEDVDAFGDILFFWERNGHLLYGI